MRENFPHAHVNGTNKRVSIIVCRTAPYGESAVTNPREPLLFNSQRILTRLMNCGWYWHTVEIPNKATAAPPCAYYNEGFIVFRKAEDS